MATTLLQAQTILARYVGYNNSSVDRLNLASQRLIQDGNWRGSKETVLFAVHPDEQERAFITLPRIYNTVLAGVFYRQNDANTLRCGWPVQVQDSWFSFLQTGPGFQDQGRFRWGQGIIPEVDRFVTFKDWITPKFLRLKFSTTEDNGLIFNIRGKYLDEIIYTGAGASMIEGENLTTNGSTLTSTSQFDSIPYELFKPITHGPVKMYTWDGVTEVHVATYAPTETLPQWRRYRVPACTEWTDDNPGFFLGICKREWQPISNANDLVVPGNLGALRFGLQALLKEDAEDYERANQLWQQAFQLLANESEDDTGSGANVPVQVADSFLLNYGTMGGNAWDYGGNWQ